jgi:DNA-binding transcriptional ArsR family regulator
MSDLKENEQSSEENGVMNEWGKTYLKVPRLLIDSLYSSVEEKRKIAILYLALMSYCYFEDGYVIVGAEKITCARGEYITSHGQLTDLTGMSGRTLRYLLKRLSEKGLIKVSRLRRGIRITLCGYDEFMSNSEKPEKKEKKGKKPKQTPWEIIEEYERRLESGILSGF